jgi:hypothetical protein
VRAQQRVGPAQPLPAAGGAPLPAGGAQAGHGSGGGGGDGCGAGCSSAGAKGLRPAPEELPAVPEHAA